MILTKLDKQIIKFRRKYPRGEFRMHTRVKKYSEMLFIESEKKFKHKGYYLMYDRDSYYNNLNYISYKLGFKDFLEASIKLGDGDERIGTNRLRKIYHDAIGAHGDFKRLKESEYNTILSITEEMGYDDVIDACLEVGNGDISEGCELLIIKAKGL